MKKRKILVYNRKGGISMSRDKLSKEWLQKNGEKLKTAYSYAIVHKYDINSKDDVLKILKIVDPDNATEKNAELYTRMLQLFRSRFRKTVGENLKKSE